MPLLFAVTMFVSATLLFLVEPMVGKMILPLLGGTPAVWNTCMVFFQALLLFGYFYSHRLTANRPPRRQITIHMAVLGCAIGVLGIGAMLADNHSPIPIVKSISPQGDEYPFFGVIVLLSVAIGLPFFVLCTSAPLLQKWFAETGHPSSKDPYFLYGASNFGSLLALIAYPAIVEPNLRLVHQAWLFAVGYGVLLVLMVFCAKAVKYPIVTVRKGGNIPPSIDDPAPPLAQRLRWLMLAAVPSSLMLAVTTSISTDMASIPLLWIVPLSLYLITFILVFSHWGRRLLTPFFNLFAEIAGAFGIEIEKQKDDHLFYVLLAPVLILLIAFLMTSGVTVKFSLRLFLYMATFFVVSMLCHGELARTRPSTKWLTNFYLIMSLGGMVGGMFNALAAPIIFDFISEYPITLVAACFLLPTMFPDAKRTSWTPWLDVLVPLLMFSLCRIVQMNQYRIASDLFTNGRYVSRAIGLYAVIAGVGFAIARPLIRDTSVRIGLGILYAVAMVGYLLMWYPTDASKSEFLVGKVMRVEGSDMPTISLSSEFLPTDLLRLVPGLLASIAFAAYFRGRVDSGLLGRTLGINALAMLVGFAVLRLFGDELFANNSAGYDPDNSTSFLRLQDSIRQIVIYGLPAMLCYLFVERPIRFGGAVAALWLASYVTEMKTYYQNDLLDYAGRSGLASRMLRECDGPLGSTELYYTRTFFGRMKIDTIEQSWTQLVHGTTVHGLQYRFDDAHSLKTLLRPIAQPNAFSSAAALLAVSETDHWKFPGRDPLTYYHRTGPVGSMFEAFYDRLQANPKANSDVACIGLGTGSLSSYGLSTQMMKVYNREGQNHRMTFFEIDLTVRRLVEPPRYFTYVHKAKNQGVIIDFEMGDARITMERVDRKFGMMLIDAFSSDAIPAHLLTKEAVQLYFDKLEEDGLLAIHISNRYMTLEPVVDQIAKELKVEARVMHGSGSNSTGKNAATWIALARKKEYLGSIETGKKNGTEHWRKDIVDAGRYVASDGTSYPLVENKPNRYYGEKDNPAYQPTISDQWMTLEGNSKVGLWTDDYYSIISVLMGEWKFWARD